MKRRFETRYWLDNRKKAPITRGFPLAEDGSIKGAAQQVARGFASKVQCIDRFEEKVLWTVKAGRRVPGVHIRPVEVFQGDA